MYRADILGHLYCIRAVLSHKRTTQFLLHLPGQSCSLYEKQARASSVSQCSHSAHLHTSEPYSTLHKLRLHMHHTQEKHSPYFSMQIPLKSLTVTCTHTHTYTHMRGLLAVSPAVEIGQPTPALVSVVLQSQSALHFLLRLTFLLRRALINILHGFYMDLFSFLLLSPRGAMATFSCLFNDCGWTINNLHTSKHSTTPTRCCRLNSQSDGKDMFSKKKKKKTSKKKPWNSSWMGVLTNLRECLVSTFASLNLPRRSREYSLGAFYKLLRWTWIISGVDHVKDLLGWFVLCLRQLVSETERDKKKKKTFVVSWVIIRDEKAGMNSRGRNYLLSSGYATGLAFLGDTVPLILSGLHNLTAMRGYKWEARLHE